MYHPDKTGNNPLTAMKFLKIQARGTIWRSLRVRAFIGGEDK